MAEGGLTFVNVEDVNNNNDNLLDVSIIPKPNNVQCDCSRDTTMLERDYRETLQQHLYMVNMYDVWKDATTGTTNNKVTSNDNSAILLANNTNDIFGIMQGMEQYKMDSSYGPKYNSIKNTMKGRANENGNIKEIELNFVKDTATVGPIDDCLFYFNESGKGAQKASSCYNSILEILTPGMIIDHGPGLGNIPFPEIGKYINFNGNFMENFGFTQEWSWKGSITTNNPTGRHGQYEIKIANIGINGTDDNIKEYANNPNKNQYLNNPIGDDINKAKKYIAMKEMGDAMQNACYIAFVNYLCRLDGLDEFNQSLKNMYENNNDNENLRNILKNRVNDTIGVNNTRFITDKSFNQYNELIQGINANRQNQENENETLLNDIKSFVYTSCTMLTSDYTVHYRNMLFNAPSIMSGIPPDSTDDFEGEGEDENPDMRKEFGTPGRRFIPILDDNEVMKNNLRSEIRNMYASYNNLASRLEYIKDQMNLLHFVVGDKTDRVKNNNIAFKKIIEFDQDKLTESMIGTIISGITSNKEYRKNLNIEMINHLKKQIEKIIECLRSVSSISIGFGVDNFANQDTEYENILEKIKFGFMPEIIKPKSKDNGTKNKYSTNGWIYMKPAVKDYLINIQTLQVTQYNQSNPQYKKLIDLKGRIISYFSLLKMSLDNNNDLFEQDTTSSPQGRRTRNIKYKVNPSVNVFDDSICFKTQGFATDDGDGADAGADAETRRLVDRYFPPSRTDTTRDNAPPLNDDGSGGDDQQEARAEEEVEAAPSGDDTGEDLEEAGVEAGDDADTALGEDLEELGVEAQEKAGDDDSVESEVVVAPDTNITSSEEISNNKRDRSGSYDDTVINEKETPIKRMRSADGRIEQIGEEINKAEGAVNLLTLAQGNDDDDNGSNSDATTVNEETYIGGGIKVKRNVCDESWDNLDLQNINEPGYHQYIYHQEIIKLVNEMRNESKIFKYIHKFLENKVPKLTGKLTKIINNTFYIGEDREDDKSFPEKFLFYLCIIYSLKLGMTSEDDTISLIYIMYSLTVSELKKFNYKLYDATVNNYQYDRIIDAFNKSHEIFAGQFYQREEEAMELEAQLVVVDNRIMRGDIEDDFDYLSLLEININNQILERHFEVNNNNEDPLVIKKYYDNILASTNHVELLTNIEPEIEVGFFIANDHELYNLLYELSMINNNMYYESIINSTIDSCRGKNISIAENIPKASPFRLQSISRNNNYFKDELKGLDGDNNSYQLNVNNIMNNIGDGESQDTSLEAYTVTTVQSQIEAITDWNNRFFEPELRAFAFPAEVNEKNIDILFKEQKLNMRTHNRAVERSWNNLFLVYDPITLETDQNFLDLPFADDEIIFAGGIKKRKTRKRKLKKNIKKPKKVDLSNKLYKKITLKKNKKKKNKTSMKIEKI